MQLLVVHKKEYIKVLLTLLEEQQGVPPVYVESIDDVDAHLVAYDYDLLVVCHEFDSTYHIVKTVRAQGRNLPIIVLAPALNSSEELVKLLDTGGDEVLTLPSSFEEFHARVRVLVRRYRGVTRSSFNVGPLLIDLGLHTAQINTTILELSSKELELLECLALSKGRILSKENLLSHLYGGIDEPEARIIDAFVWRLRRKIEEAGGNGNIIQTVWGRGYRLSEDMAHM